MPKQTMPVFYVKTKFKPQATGQKLETKIFNWVTLNSIPLVPNIWATSNLLHLVHLLYTKMCSFVHIIDKLNLAFLLAFHS